MVLEYHQYPGPTPRKLLFSAFFLAFLFVLSNIILVIASPSSVSIASVEGYCWRSLITSSLMILISSFYFVSPPMSSRMRSYFIPLTSCA